MKSVEKKPTKYYSSIQENRIADYLGWSAVSASGARPFTPGDIKSAKWLAECKTHTSETKRITIDKSVWKKIATEAKGCFRSPVLFVDNGTQELDNTWAIFPKRLYFGDELNTVLLKFSETDKKLTFNHADFYMAFRPKYTSTIIFIDSESLYIVKIKTFKEIICKAGE